MTDQEILAKINRLQERCLIHRCCYYVYSESVIDDCEYDREERDLRWAREDHPELWEKSQYRAICPTETVGSDDIKTYPPEIIHAANEAISDHRDQVETFKRWEKDNC